MDSGETEEQVLALREQVETLQGRLEQAQQGTHVFVAMLAHELRTPLGAILMWAHVLRMGRESDREAALDAIETSARAQSKLIGGLLDVTRGLAGRLRIDKKGLVDLGEAARHAIAELNDTAVEAGVTVELSGDNSPLWVRGDASRLRQMISILVEKAIRANGGQGVIEVRITVTEGTGEGVAHLRVSDHGPAASPEQLRHMFDAFRPPADPERQRPGTLAVELPLVRLLAELHGGTATAQSGASDTGNTFTLSLPTTQA